MRTLGPGEWLNDTVVDCYSEIVTRGTRTLALGSGVAAFLLLDGPTASQRWLRGRSVLDYDHVVLPFVANKHWMTASFDVRKRELVVLDSGRRFRTPTTKMRKALCAFYAHQLSLAGLPCSVTERVLADVPQQTNGDDCGVFACAFVHEVARGSFEFASRDAPRMREEVMLRLLL